MIDQRPSRGLTRADLMTATEVAELFAVPLSTVYHWGRTGVVPCRKFGRHVRFIRAEVERIILGNGREATPIEDRAEFVARRVGRPRD